MQERQVSIEGTTHPLPDPFVVLATQNPIEFEGTFALPQAQLDRFLVRIQIGYPDEAGERRIARRHQADAEPLDAIEPIVDAARLLALRDEVRRVHVGDEVEAYVVALVRATRGARRPPARGEPAGDGRALPRRPGGGASSPGRAFVLPDDVKAVAPAVLAHRLVVDLDRSLRGATRRRRRWRRSSTTVPGPAARRRPPGAGDDRPGRSPRSSWSSPARSLDVPIVDRPRRSSCSCSRRSARSGPGTACAA